MTTLPELGPNPMTPLTPEEYTALRHSIAEHGVMVPVLVNQHGRVIDGHYRMTIARELGIDVPTTTKHYGEASSVGQDLTDEEMVDALGLNAQRRQLDDYSAGMMNLKLLELYGIESRPGRRPVGQKTTAEIAALAGQSLRTFQRRVSLAKLLSEEQHEEVRDKLVSGEISTRQAIQEVAGPDPEPAIDELPEAQVLDRDLKVGWQGGPETDGENVGLGEDTAPSVDLSEDGGGHMGSKPPVFKEFDEDLETEHRCPKCGYEWSGSSR